MSKAKMTLREIVFLCSLLFALCNRLIIGVCVMRNKTSARVAQWIGFIVVMTVIGLSFAACNDDSGPGPDRNVAPAIITKSLPNGTVGTAYDQTLVATGGNITWTIESGALPDGLSLAAIGAIVGTPTAAGTSYFTVKATNAVGNDTKELSITITGTNGGIAPTITTEALTGGTVGTVYSQTLAATGGTPITWTIESGDLPDGLILAATGAITGMPSTAGTSYFTVKATNDAGNSKKPFSITITGSSGGVTAPTITTTSLPKGIVGTTYSQTLTATGAAPIAWTIDSGTLPNGLNLVAGAITGTPTAAGTSTFTVKATNSLGSDTKPLSITITFAAPTIITEALPNGTLGVAYNQTLAATGATPITWDLYYQTLPEGLELAENGTITGTPTATGTVAFTVRATNSVSYDLKRLSITINLAAPTITTAALPSGTVGAAYSQTLAATGDTPITWSLDSGTLPAGLDIAADGTIAGTPTATGTSTFTAKATNANGSGTKQLSIIIDGQKPAIGGMEWIPAGVFMMGSPTSETGRGTDETHHQVTLTKGFYMGKYPVTQAEYLAVMGSNPSAHSAGGQYADAVAGLDTTNFPVERISWYAALVFCNKLSMQEGLNPAYSISGSTNPASWGAVPDRTNSTWNAVEIVEGSNGYRLPTEAQWEYACRADTTTAFNLGNEWSGDWGWYRTNSGDRTHEVGGKSPNEWGLYDMHGNVTEWCWDWEGMYGTGEKIDPTGADYGGNARIRRGGSFINFSENNRSAARASASPFLMYSYMGFRIVRP
jgi:formylglycine-generating enzyme required for sulfatase activity